MNIEIQNTPQNIVSLVTPKLKLLPEFFNNIVPASASGEKVGFMNTVGLPLRFIDVATEIVAQQDLNGYDHPWASGGDGIQQWDEEWEVGGLDSSGNPVPATQIRSKNYIPVIGGETYFIKSPYSSGIGIYQYDSSKTYITRGFYADTAITLNDNTKYLKFRTSDGVTTYNHDISINYPSTNHDYYPWANICPITGFTGANIRVNATPAEQGGFTYPVTWSDEAGTVYGGEVDVTKGKLTLTHEYQQLLSANVGTVSKVGTYASVVNITPAHPLEAHEDLIMPDLLCDSLPTRTSSALWANDEIGITTTVDGTKIRVRIPNAITANDVRTFLTNNIVMISAKLATPIEYDITPVDAIKMLNGQNFVWSNTGNISVVYYKKVGANDNVQTIMRSSAPSLGMERQEVEDRPLDDIRLGDGLIREVREPIEREEIEDEPVEIAEEEPQDEEPVEEETEEPVEEPQEEQK